MADMGLTAADAQMDGLLLDATTGDWYDPNDVIAVQGVAVNGGGIHVEPASSFVAVSTRPLRGSPYDRTDGRDENDPEGYTAMIQAQLGVARAKSVGPPARPPPPPIPVVPAVVFKAAPLTLTRQPLIESVVGAGHTGGVPRSDGS